MLHPLLESSLEIKKMKLDLERFRLFDQKLGSPSTSFKTIHVAGTNGKGTVSFKIASSLEAIGKKVGLFTSPHIKSYHERIQINGFPIPEEDASRILEQIRATLKEELSYFEWITLLAFIYFAEKKVNVAVLEVGMGGRLDTTNIVTPLLSVITSIGFDHMQYLGTTMDAIAFEKAGIIKPNVPVVIGPKAEPRAVFTKIAEERNSPLFIVDQESSDYEEENVYLVKRALSLLPFKFTKKALDAAENARLPCRCEEVYPGVIFDVGHNPPAFLRTFEKVQKKFPNRPIRVLAAFSRDKDTSEMVKILKMHATFIHLTEAKHERAWDVSEMKNDSKIECEPDFDVAFEKAFLLSKKENQILVVCGTFFIMEHALSKLNWVRARDLNAYDRQLPNAAKRV